MIEKQRDQFFARSGNGNCVCGMGKAGSAAMRFAVLGSGSGGNATLIESGGRYLLVDAGLSAKQLSLRLHALGVAPGQISGVLLTHEHGDHVRGLDVFLQKNPVPVLATSLTGRVVQEKMKNAAAWVSFQCGQSFAWEGFEISTFALPHDAVEPVGFVVGRGEGKVGVVTDLGHVTDKIVAALAGVKGLVVEANYEWEMLEADQKRPFSIKQRISSQHGHLSNDQAADLVAQLVPSGLRNVILGHLSRDCNCPIRAERAVRERVPEGLSVCLAGQDEVTPWKSAVAEVDPAFYGELFGRIG